MGALSIRERCLIAQSDAGGPVMLNAIYNNNYSFLVTPGYFVIYLEMNHDVRIAPIFASAAKARASHAPVTIRPWKASSAAPASPKARRRRPRTAPGRPKR